MEDNEIIDLYWQRQEQAIAATDMKYGRMCMYIAGHILSAREDAEECVSDTYLACWNTMPPKRPNVLSAFISRITRNLSLKRYEYLTAEKRNQNAAVSLEELGDCLSGKETPEGALETKQVIQALNHFLWKQPEQARDMFLRRYWYFDTVTEIAKRHHCSVDQVSASLYRTRKRLKAFLEKEGIGL